MKLLIENWRKYLKEAKWTEPSERNLPEPPWGPRTQEWDVVNKYNERNAHLGYHELENPGMIGWADQMDRWVMKNATDANQSALDDHKAKREELKSSLSAAGDEEVENTDVEVAHVDKNMQPLPTPAYSMTIEEITAPHREDWAQRNSPLMTGRKGRVYTPTAKEWYLGIDAEGNPSGPKEWVAKAGTGASTEEM